MRRIVVLGGCGFFGAAAVARLRADRMAPLVAGRRTAADLAIDAEDRASLRRALGPHDIVIDAAGPFQNRTTALVETALERGFDLIDLSDSLDYALKMCALERRIAAAGIRVLTSCSSASAVTTALVGASGIADPRRVSVFLAPATRYTANRGTAGSLRHSLGRPIRVRRGGRLVEAIGWRDTRSLRMPSPVGAVRGHLMESVDAVMLPRVWPGIRDVDFWVDPRSRAVAAAFSLAARWPAARRIVNALQPYGLPLVRRLGSTSGGFAVEVEGATGAVAAVALVAGSGSYVTAVAPAVLAATALAEGRFGPCGLVPHDQQVKPGELTEYLAKLGIETHTMKNAA